MISFGGAFTTASATYYNTKYHYLLCFYIYAAAALFLLMIYLICKAHAIILMAALYHAADIFEISRPLLPFSYLIDMIDISIYCTRRGAGWHLNILARRSQRAAASIRKVLFHAGDISFYRCWQEAHAGLARKTLGIRKMYFKLFAAARHCRLLISISISALPRFTSILPSYFRRWRADFIMLVYAFL